MNFLKRIKEAKLPRLPFVLVTTNNVSAITHEIARELGADFIMTKNQVGYSAQSVLDFLKIAKNVIINRKNQPLPSDFEESPTQTAQRLQRRICLELDKVGISAKSIGYSYLIDAIAMTVKEPVQHLCDKIGIKYRKSSTSVERAMQNAIKIRPQKSNPIRAYLLLRNLYIIMLKRYATIFYNYGPQLSCSPNQL